MNRLAGRVVRKGRYRQLKSRQRSRYPDRICGMDRQKEQKAEKQTG
jgi:hypothetical protein